jgi:2-polyprenyl-6-methoxyphenol hydroxylase-like FAD-dependent oxidoreductase
LEGLALEMKTLNQERTEAQRQLELATTKSDRNGVLTWVVNEEGATVQKGAVLARIGFEVVLLERENSYPDRVRGEFMAPWGVTELAKLELLQPLREAGALFTKRNIPYDENFAPAEAEARALDLTKMHAEGFGALCLGHPATCDIFAQLATASGASVLRGTGVTSGSWPIVSCAHDRASLEFRPRLVICADGRNSSARKKLGFKVNADQPRNLLGGMLVKGVPSWPRDMQVIGV